MSRIGQAARDGNEKHDLTGKFSHGAGIAARKTAEAGQVTWKAAKDTNDKHDITGKISTATKKTAEAAKETNDKHDITGKLGHGASVAAHKTKDGVVIAAHKTREFDQKYQVSTAVADGARSAAQAMKETNAKHNITGKVAQGASTAASGVAKGISSLRNPSADRPQEPAAQKPAASFNPFGAPQDAWASDGGRTQGLPAANPFATQPHGGSQPHGGQVSMKDKVVNKAATHYTGGLVTHVPPAVSDAAIDYAKRNPQQAANMASSAVKATKGF